MARKKRRSHFCWVCGSQKPNEAFSGDGHREHVCSACARLGPDELATRRALRDVERAWYGLRGRARFEKLATLALDGPPRARAYAKELLDRSADEHRLARGEHLLDVPALDVAYEAYREEHAIDDLVDALALEAGERAPNAWELEADDPDGYDDVPF